MKKRSRILLIEDNVNFGVRIYSDLVHVGQTSWINSESEFEKYWHLIESEPPDVAVLDVMLAWDHPSKGGTVTPPGGVPDLYTAGIRCAERFASNEKTRNVRIVFYTVVPEEDVSGQVRKLAERLPDVIYLQKPYEIGSVVAKIIQVIPGVTPAIR